MHGGTAGEDGAVPDGDQLAAGLQVQTAGGSASSLTDGAIRPDAGPLPVRGVREPSGVKHWNITFQIDSP